VELATRSATDRRSRLICGLQPTLTDFELFRGPLVAALRRGPRNKGGRPPFDPVLMFKILVL